MPPGWPATRARILARDRHRCTSCGAPANQVHHLLPGTEADEWLTSRCGDCHGTETAAQAAAARASARP